MTDRILEYINQVIFSLLFLVLVDNAGLIRLNDTNHTRFQRRESECPPFFPVFL